MRTAVCFSGQARSIVYTYRNLLRNFIWTIPDCDVFIHLAEDEFCILNYPCFEEFKPCKLVVEKDPVIYEGGMKDCLRIPLQNYLRMLRSWKRANELKTEYEESLGFKYDCVIRTRLDIKLFEPFPAIETFNLNKVCIPDFHWWSCVTGAGYNDRMAIGTSENIDIVSNMIDYLEGYSKDGHIIHSESTFYHHLKKNNIEIAHYPIRFTRVRSNGVEEDDYLRKDPAFWPPNERF